ncbi:MAG: ABC transporter permease subunit [Gammaproteobacteria bacterium]
MSARPSRLATTWMVGAFMFLYLPIVSLVIYSFNANRLVTVWSGFSTRWYAALFRNAQVLDAALLSLQIALVSASLAVVLGTLVAVCLSRFGPFRGRALLSGLATAPLVMPEVITGLSLLLLFVALEQAIGWPSERGLLTVVIAHTTFALAYVAVVVQSRLVGLDPSLEEAALDLGARPATVFFRITLPLIAPALVAGWLLAFTLSLDDLVIASFVSGPGATTLPMLIYSKVRLGLSPEINALASLLLAVVTSAAVGAGWLLARARAPVSGQAIPTSR